VRRKSFEQTQRGFNIYGQMTDGYQSTIRVQESSNIEKGVWIFCDQKTDRPRTNHLGLEDYQTAPHLMSAKEIDELINLLKLAKKDVFG
jgi:hypothetical protein